MSEALIVSEGLGFSYGQHAVLEGIDLAIDAGEIFGLVGPDGAGKTTLLRIAAGQLEPSEGQIRVLGEAPSTPALRHDLAYMPQGFGLYPDLSVAENLGFFADLHGLDRATASERLQSLLERTGLAGFEDRRGGQLSGGMMQKLALGCVLVSAPRVMFLDEPTTGVDPVSRRAFWRLLDGVREEGVAILYATANMDEAERCERVAMLEAGRLRRQGTPLELVSRHQAILASISGPHVRSYRERVRALEAVEVVFPMGPRLNCWLRPGASLEDLHQGLQAIDERLAARALTPGLHDAALRELALRDSGDGHG